MKPFFVKISSSHNEEQRVLSSHLISGSRINKGQIRRSQWSFAEGVNQRHFLKITRASQFRNSVFYPIKTLYVHWSYMSLCTWWPRIFMRALTTIFIWYGLWQLNTLVTSKCDVRMYVYSIHSSAAQLNWETKNGCWLGPLDVKINWSTSRHVLYSVFSTVVISYSSF